MHPESVLYISLACCEVTRESADSEDVGDTVKHTEPARNAGMSHSTAHNSLEQRQRPEPQSRARSGAPRGGPYER